MQFRLTPVVRHLIIINVIIYVGLLLLSFRGGAFIYNDYFSLHKSNALGVHNTVNVNGKDILLKRSANAAEVQQYVDTYPEARRRYAEKGQALDKFLPLQVVTYFFSHSLDDILHIAFNMFLLAILGPITESVIGSKRFLRFYLFCGVFAGLALAFLDPSVSHIVGASTAVSGVMVAFALLFPRQKIHFFLLPFGFEARWLVLGMAGLSVVLTVSDIMNPGSGGNVSHFGHLMGMVGAVVYFYLENFIPALRQN